MIRKLLMVTSVMCVLNLSAEIPVGYYDGINGKTTEDLKTALHEIIYPHTQVSSYSDLPSYFAVTDVYPDGQRWWEMYSGKTFYLPSFSGMNREHSLPKSWWGGSSSTPAYTDLNHLYPSEMAANTAKSNYPLGEVLTATFDNGVSKVGYAVNGQGGGAKYVFEPDDAYKGDFARTYFYMVTCYQNLTWKYKYMIQQGAYPSLTGWAIDLLLKWHRDDPVSQKEIDRNEAVYKFQNNRNPFIDFPELAEYIWGNKTGLPFDSSNIPDNPTGDPVLITPVQSMSLDFGEVAIGSEVSNRLLFKGENLTGALSLTVYSGDKDQFELSESSIKAQLVNSEEGYWLTVKYSPTAIGSHTSKLLVSDGGMDGSSAVVLTGACREVPSLSQLTATAATDITETSYIANWDETADLIDYYVVTRTRYESDGATVEELVAEDNFIEITEYNPSVKETYSVQSSRLGYRSIASNVITVDVAGITGVEIEQPLGVVNYSGGIRLIMGEPHSNVSIYDTLGRCIMTMPMVYNNHELNLPVGLYLIMTDRLITPLRVMVY